MIHCPERQQEEFCSEKQKPTLMGAHLIILMTINSILKFHLKGKLLPFVYAWFKKKEKGTNEKLKRKKANKVYN